LENTSSQYWRGTLAHIAVCEQNVFVDKKGRRGRGVGEGWMEGEREEGRKGLRKGGRERLTFWEGDYLRPS